MARTITDARQVTIRQYLQQIASATGYAGTSDAKPANQSELDNLLASINAELTPLLRLTANSPASLIVNVGAGLLTNSESSFSKALPTIGANTPNFAGGTITFPASPGTVTVSPGNNATFSMGANEYIKALVYLDANNNLNLIFGTSNATEANATVTAAPDSVIPIGFITLQTIAGVVQVIPQTKIYQYVGTGAGGSGSGSGVLEVAPGYKMLINDSFSAIQGSADDTVYSTYTKATYDAGKKLYRLLCDKSKTVNTSSGTALTINSAPSFTVQVGDIVYMTNGARIGQWRRIGTVNSQTDFVLDAAFSGGDAANGNTLMISQAVWIQDLVNYGSVTELTRPRDFYPNENVNQVLIDYMDSLAANDDVGDFTQTARIVMSACNEGLQADTDFPLTTFWNQGSAVNGNLLVRPAAPSSLSHFPITANTDDERLFLVFFCNPGNGSVTAGANLLDYTANFYQEAEAINGGVLASAYGTSDNSTTTYNGTISTSGGFTRFDLNFDVNPSVDPGGVGAQVKVTVNGQDVPKFISSGVNPSSQLSYTVTTDSNGLYRRILFSTDLSVATVDIMIIKQFGVYDASFTQSNKLIGLYDAIVGSAAQVTAGTATHSSLQAAHDAVVVGSNILVLNNVTLSGNTTLSKRLMISGKGPGSVLSGNLTVASGALGSIIKWLKVSGNVTFNSGANKCFMTDCYMTGSFSNDPVNLDNVLESITE